jgi:hypothetical protein
MLQGGYAMEKYHKILGIIIVLCVVGFLLTIADFLALHDIHHDFIGTEVVKLLDITIGEDLPEWTATKGEWDIVRVSYIFRLMFFVSCAIVLVRLKIAKP